MTTAVRDFDPIALGAGCAALMRPHHWIKNGFVLVGLVFAHRWDESGVAAALAFCAFCAMASAVYIYNDLQDVEDDRRHPTKCLRPIASGVVAPGAAGVLLAGLVLLGLVLAAQVSPTALYLVAGYAALNVAYTHHLKKMVIIDVFTISLGFMLRLLVGTLGLGIKPSSWLLLCGLMVTLFLGFAKRRAELLGSSTAAGAPTRAVLMAYQPQVLDQFLAVTAGATVLAYALYTVSTDTIALHHTDQLIYTLPFIVYGMFRYLFMLHNTGSGQDTARDLMTDRHLLVTIAGWVLTTMLILA
jgi:4-hydroxybenzoate polyprenyltransferase